MSYCGAYASKIKDQKLITRGFSMLLQKQRPFIINETTCTWLWLSTLAVEDEKK